MFTSPPFSYVLSHKINSAFADSHGFISQGLPCGRNFYCDDTLKVSIQTDLDTGGYLLLAGLAIDIQTPSSDLEQISSRLIAALKESDEMFYRLVDFIAGRWICIFRSGRAESVRVMSDATNMLKVNYVEDGSACSSNIFLLNKFIGNETIEYRKEFAEQRDLWKFGSLGNLSPIANFKILTPNHILILKGAKVRRFYPREELKELSVDEVVEEILYYAKVQTSRLVNKYSLFYSLTAGIDSRFSVALSSELKNDVSHFTYLFNDTNVLDMRLSLYIASRLGLEHYALTSDSDEYEAIAKNGASKVFRVKPDNALIKTVRQWSWYSHQLRIIPAYREMVDATAQTSCKEPLHMRSNLYEIGRAFWGSREHGPCRDRSEVLKRGRADWAENCSSIFEEFMDETAIDVASTANLDLLDVFYWEHRCGTWVSEVLQESDFVFNTHSLVNCRKILELLLCVKFEDRVKSTVFHNIINRKLPEIRDIPINPVNFP
jgi:hypothetical protein